MPLTIRPSFSFSVSSSRRLSEGQPRLLVIHPSPPYHQETSIIFVLMRRKVASEKSGTTCASLAARPATGGTTAHTPIRARLPDSPTGNIPTRPTVLLGSSNSISEHKAVREVLEGISESETVIE